MCVCMRVVIVICVVVSVCDYCVCTMNDICVVTHTLLFGFYCLRDWCRSRERWGKEERNPEISYKSEMTHPHIYMGPS